MTGVFASTRSTRAASAASSGEATSGAEANAVAKAKAAVIRAVRTVFMSPRGGWPKGEGSASQGGATMPEGRRPAFRRLCGCSAQGFPQAAGSGESAGFVHAFKDGRKSVESEPPGTSLKVHCAFGNADKFASA